MSISFSSKMRNWILKPLSKWDPWNVKCTPLLETIVANTGAKVVLEAPDPSDPLLRLDWNFRFVCCEILLLLEMGAIFPSRVEREPGSRKLMA
jgi:hypothetical protein